MKRKTKTNLQILEATMRRLGRLTEGDVIGRIDYAALARELPFRTLAPAQIHEAEYDALVEYLRQKTTARDWHAVSDAANDLRVLVARHPDLENA